jgi:hypothetical protein
MKKQILVLTSILSFGLNVFAEPKDTDLVSLNLPLNASIELLSPVNFPPRENHRYIEDHVVQPPPPSRTSGCFITVRTLSLRDRLLKPRLMNIYNVQDLTFGKPPLYTIMIYIDGDSAVESIQCAETPIGEHPFTIGRLKAALKSANMKLILPPPDHF